MKRLMLVVLFFSTISLTAGEVSTRVCLAGECLPGVPDPNIIIMVGTKLTIIVSSDANDVYLPCDLAIQGNDRDYGVLSDANLLEGAAPEALLYPLHDDFLEIDGFSFTGEGNAGDWFSVDYTATAIGDCNVGFYEWWAMEPTYEISFTHVRTRDFDKSTKVDLVDFTILASYWQVTNCQERNLCEGAALDTDDDVDRNDLRLFVEYWLEKTE